jgi:hypothetical protein
MRILITCTPEGLKFQGSYGFPESSRYFKGWRFGSGLNVPKSRSLDRIVIYYNLVAEKPK